MKKCVYYSIMGNYDTLKKPSFITKGWDYICFTNNKSLKSNFFKIVYVDNDENLNNAKLSRKIKINFHKYVGDYDLSLYVDGHIHIRGDLNAFVNRFLGEDDSIDMSLSKHPTRKCVYGEAYACKKFGKGDPKMIDYQMSKYKKDGLPRDLGMVACGTMIRKHNRKNLERHCELWWQEVKKYSGRDQISFKYILWKYNLIKISTFNYKYVRGKNKGKKYLKLLGHIE